MTDADNMTPDIQIWIGINPDHFWLRLDALAEVCALWAQSNYYY